MVKRDITISLPEDSIIGVLNQHLDGLESVSASGLTAPVHKPWRDRIGQRLVFMEILDIVFKTDDVYMELLEAARQGDPEAMENLPDASRQLKNSKGNETEITFRAEWRDV